MSMKPVFDVKLFEYPNDPSDQKRSQDALLVMLEALVMVNQLWLKTHRNTPKIYRAPVRYEREYGTELWCDIPTILEKGYGDCEDVACWWVAEKREEGGKASPYVRYRKVDGKFHYHCLASYLGKNPATGAYGKWIEDPSKKLGMGWEERYAELMKKKGVQPRSIFDRGSVAGDANPGNNFGGMGLRMIRPDGYKLCPWEKF